MFHGIEAFDRFGASVVFLAESMVSRFGPMPELDHLMEMLATVETARAPAMGLEQALAPVDAIVHWVRQFPHLVELIGSVLGLAVANPATEPVAQGVLRAVMWVAMRLDPADATEKVLEIFRAATPGATFQADQWPPHEFFAALTVLVYLGDARTRLELHDLLAAAQELGHHDLAPIIDWHLDQSYGTHLS